jgi:hypothetical protein
MRFVVVKSAEQQASGVVFRARDLAEFGIVVAKGPVHV